MRRRSAFTLIELLVVISIIALLISILIPSLSAARRQSKDVACRAHLSGLVKSNFTYQTDNQEWIPGVNTTGVALKKAAWPGGLTEEVLRRGSLPVQPYDWMTPLLQQEMDLTGSNRADRLALVTEKYNCPEQRSIESILYGVDDAPDAEDFQGRVWTALSYLQPIHFQFWGGRYKNRVLARVGSMGLFDIRAQGAPEDWEIEAGNYRSRVSDLGTPARKVFAADGTRFVTAEGVLDHDISPLPTNFGAFCSSGAWWRGSTTYGVKAGTPGWGDDGVMVTAMSGGSVSNGRNLRYSYRHGGNAENDTNGSAQTNNGRINAAFFDGSVQPLTDKESRKPWMWYPKGTVITKPNEGMTVVPENWVIKN